MRVMILGGDGYLGWPTAMAFSARGDEVMVVDNFAKRRWELEDGIEPLMPVPGLHRRIKVWREVSGKDIELRVGDLLNHRFVYKIFEEFPPDVIVHYGEQPSAPYSMQGREAAAYTQHNNVIGNLNVLFAMRHAAPDSHLVKLGTMGEYGTPNIDIEEGWLEVSTPELDDVVRLEDPALGDPEVVEAHAAQPLLEEHFHADEGQHQARLRQGQVIGTHEEGGHPEGEAVADEAGQHGSGDRMSQGRRAPHVPGDLQERRRIFGALPFRFGGPAARLPHGEVHQDGEDQSRRADVHEGHAPAHVVR